MCTWPCVRVFCCFGPRQNKLGHLTLLCHKINLNSHSQPVFSKCSCSTQKWTHIHNSRAVLSSGAHTLSRSINLLLWIVSCAYWRGCSSFSVLLRFLHLLFPFLTGCMETYSSIFVIQTAPIKQTLKDDNFLSLVCEWETIALFLIEHQSAAEQRTVLFSCAASEATHSEQCKQFARQRTGTNSGFALSLEGLDWAKQAKACWFSQTDPDYSQGTTVAKNFMCGQEQLLLMNATDSYSSHMFKWSVRFLPSNVIPFQ